MHTPSPHAPASAPAGLVGRTGVVVSRIRTDRPGEVRLVDRGLPHTVLARAAEPLPVGTHVLVVLDAGDRQVDVVAWSAPVATPADL